MIVHFLEVWLLIVVTFIVGCVFGALLYDILADSRLAIAQGRLADGVGDVVDGIKGRLGMGPAWRKKQMSRVARPAPEPVAASEAPVPSGRAPVPSSGAPVPQALEAAPEFDEEAEPETRVARAPDSRPEPIARVASRRLTRQTRPGAPPLAPPPEPELTQAGGDPNRLASAEKVRRDGVLPMRPMGLSGPRSGLRDDLTRIRGIGRRNEDILNGLGIYHFSQIASWTPGEVRWIGQYLAFPERIERDDWVGQAVMLASGTETGFVKSAERRRERRRREREELATRAAAERAGQAAQAEPEFADEDPVEPAESVDPGDTLAAELRAARRQSETEDWQIDEFTEDVGREEVETEDFADDDEPGPSDEPT